MLEVTERPEGRAAVARGVEEATAELRPDLATGLLGGTQLAYEVTVKRLSVRTTVNVASGFIDSGVPDPENGAYDYVVIAGKKHTVTLRTNLSMRDAKNQRVLTPDDVEWLGNVIVFLDEDGIYALVVSCSGLNDVADEAAAELFAAKIKRYLLMAKKQLELAA